MKKAFKFAKLAWVVVLCLASFNLANADSVHGQKKTKKPVLPPLPSGPTGPVPQIPLDSIAPVPPQVSYQNGQLAIVALNSTLGDILRAVRKQTGAEIEIPDAKERVVTHLGPGPAREVMAELLNGSRFNYVLLGSPSDANALTRVVLVMKTGPDNPVATNQPTPSSAMNQAANMAQQQDADANDADAPDENADDSAVEQPAEEQPTAQPDQPGVKTPQQLLQEMQQRQLQMQQQQQQQQQPGQPVPGVPQRPPQNQQQ